MDINKHKLFFQGYLKFELFITQLNDDSCETVLSFRAMLWSKLSLTNFIKNVSYVETLVWIVCWTGWDQCSVWSGLHGQKTLGTKK